MMEQGYFITGTDTHAGKTWATITLMHYFKSQGNMVVGLKPVASGCFWRNGKLVNDDALQIMEHSTVQLPYELVNPYAYEMPVSPHLACHNNPVDIDKVCGIVDKVKTKTQILLIEGAGGWYSPVNNTLYNSDLAIALAQPVILVVGITLGCINHAMLTHQAIVSSGLHCAGWIAVCHDPDVMLRDNIIETLKGKLSCRNIAVLPYSKGLDTVALARCIEWN
jgi:dethiobiotin synthetase